LVCVSCYPGLALLAVLQVHCILQLRHLSHVAASTVCFLSQVIEYQLLLLLLLENV
jgi:hypothetical protein